MKTISLLGSTGSIGVQTLQTVASSNGELRIASLAAGKNITLLIEQINIFKPTLVSVTQQKDAEKLQTLFPKIKVLWGEEGLVAAATVPEANIVLVAVVGVAALKPTIEAIKLKKDIALASKEILVAAGDIVTKLVKQYGVKLLPVDSEHSAIMQSCPPEINPRGYFTYPIETIAKIILTASGGAFRDTTEAELKYKTLADALKHPNWQMGKKITIDSATLMNKGLEVIEAHWLFGVPYDQIEVVIHPQSIIHSLVEYIDGSVIAQLGVPDMRIPIQHALHYPERKISTSAKLSLTELGSLTFRKPNVKLFKSLNLAYQAGRQGGTMPAVLNAANEEAVNLFTEEKIKFTEIPELIEKILNQHQVVATPELEDIITADAWARKKVLEVVKSRLHV